MTSPIERMIDEACGVGLPESDEARYKRFRRALLAWRDAFREQADTRSANEMDEMAKEFERLARSARERA
jgi:hypothetical protein